MDANNTPSFFRAIVSEIRLGSGIVGKSAIVLGILELCIVVAVWRLHNDSSILAALGFGALFLFLWLFQIIRFANRHPAAALLEGSTWAEHERFIQVSSKGMTPDQLDQALVLHLPAQEPEEPR
jgi:hypothetical protein